ncbi:MAG: GyrI-like domain-containing protein [Chloroflexi bacterium]|nr:GyrI-like domain-containing protein [Chloroflexota bacterium]
MKTLDLKKELKYLYAPPAKKVEIVKVPPLQFAMIDGAIEKGHSPGDSPGFQEAVQALYGISYTLKFMFKKRKTNPIDYPVMALEGLLWLTVGKVFDITIKDNWSYTLMILQSDIITKDIFEEGLAQVRKKRGDSDALSKLRLARFEEGLCAQVMHIGPYATEPATIERMKNFIKENGYRDCVGRDRKHHEIYMGDPRKADPAKLKTVLRHPIEKI